MITVGGMETNYGLQLEEQRQIMITVGGPETNCGLQLEVLRQIMAYSWRYRD